MAQIFLKKRLIHNYSIKSCFNPKFGYKKTNQLAFDVKGNLSYKIIQVYLDFMYLYIILKFTLEYDVNNMKLLL